MTIPEEEESGSCCRGEEVYMESKNGTNNEDAVLIDWECGVNVDVILPGSDCENGCSLNWLELHAFPNKVKHLDWHREF